MSVVPVAELMQSAQRIFVQREASLESEAADRSVEDLKQTVIAVRRMLKAAATGLPESAYERQPDDVDGSDVWSAGEVISHIAETMIWTDANITKITGQAENLPSDEIKQHSEMRVRTKEESLAALDAADRELNRILDGIAEDIDTSATIDHDTFGTVGVKGWLLLTALHEGDHANQLRELGG